MGRGGTPETPSEAVRMDPHASERKLGYDEEPEFTPVENFLDNEFEPRIDDNSSQNPRKFVIDSNKSYFWFTDWDEGDEGFPHHSDVLRYMYPGDTEPSVAIFGNWEDTYDRAGNVYVTSTENGIGEGTKMLLMEHFPSESHVYYGYDDAGVTVGNLLEKVSRVSERNWWKSAVGEPVGVDPTDYYKQVDEAYEKNKWWDDDPFAEEEYDEVIDEEAQYQEKILNDFKQDEKSELYRIIMDAGGIQTGDLREEYKGIPNTFKRRDGLRGDEMAEYLSTYHPEYGIQDERDLIDAMTDRYRFSKGASMNWNDKQSSWWTQADPRFEERSDGQYDLQMNAGDDPADWSPQNFRVGDEVLYLPTGVEGHIEETLDVDHYSVMLDNGDIVEATPADLQHNDNNSDGDTTILPEDINRFEGDDPEAQNFEDPTFSLNGYIDDDIDQLRVGDKVRILYTTDEALEGLVNAMGTIVSAEGGTYNVDVDGASLNGAERQSIELMPTDFNPHYGGGLTASWWKSAADPQREEKGQIGKEYDLSINMQYLTTHWPQEEMVANVMDAYEKSSDTQKYAGTEWYNDIHEKSKEMAERYGYTFEQMCAVFAVISPQNSWDANYVQAIAFVEAHNAGVLEWTDVRIWTPYSYTGKPCGLPNNNEKAWEILDTGDTSYIEYAESPKVFSFFQNFINGPDSVDNRATIDVWATRVLFADPLVKPLINTNDGSYPYLEQAYITAGEQTGLTPKQIQAVTWVYFKEFYGKSLGDMSYMKRFDEYVQTPYEERGDPPVEDLPLRPKKKKVDPKDYMRDEQKDFEYDANKNEWRSKKKRRSEQTAYEELLKQETKRQREEKKRNKKVRSWWTGASISSVNEAMHSIVEAMGFLEGKNDTVVSHLREALSNLEHESTLEASHKRAIDQNEFNQMWGEEPPDEYEMTPYEMAWRSENDVIPHQLDAENDMFSELYDEGVEEARVGMEPRDVMQFESEEEYNMYMSGYDAYNDFPKHSWWKGAAGLGDTAEFLIEQVATGVMPYETAHAQMNDMKMMLEDPKEVFELDARIKILEEMEKNPQQNVAPDLTYQQNPMQEQEDAALPRAGWWDS